MTNADGPTYSRADIEAAYLLGWAIGVHGEPHFTENENIAQSLLRPLDEWLKARDDRHAEQSRRI